MSERVKDIYIEKMSIEHIPLLVEIEKECFSKPWTEEGFLAELKNDTANFYTAMSGEKAVGYMGFYIICRKCCRIALLQEKRNCRQTY